MSVKMIIFANIFHTFLETESRIPCRIQPSVNLFYTVLTLLYRYLLIPPDMRPSQTSSRSVCYAFCTERLA